MRGWWGPHHTAEWEDLAVMTETMPKPQCLYICVKNTTSIGLADLEPTWLIFSFSPFQSSHENIIHSLFCWYAAEVQFKHENLLPTGSTEKKPSHLTCHLSLLLPANTDNMLSTFFLFLWYTITAVNNIWHCPCLLACLTPPPYKLWLYSVFSLLAPSGDLSTTPTLGEHLITSTQTHTSASLLFYNRTKREG